VDDHCVCVCRQNRFTFTFLTLPARAAKFPSWVPRLGTATTSVQLANHISKTQIDKLGDRLRKGDITEADLRLLDAYRRSFSEAYEFVVGAIRNKLALEPTGRPAKSTTSIAEKLERESIRLTQVQDIAGCRLIVPGLLQQNSVVSSLSALFDNVSVVDRRQSQPWLSSCSRDCKLPGKSGGDSGANFVTTRLGRAIRKDV
jgi:hypothetical protein